MPRRLRVVWLGLCLAFALAASHDAAAQLALAIEAPRDTVRPGLSVVVELTATNTGALPVAGVSIQLDYPLGVIALNQNFASADGSCLASGNLNATCNAGEVVTWTLGSLGPGARKTVTMPVFVPGGGSSPPNGTVFTLNARVLEGAVVRASVVETTTVHATPNFDVALDDSVDPVEPGGTLVYTASFSNVGLVNAPGSVLSLALPAGTTFLSASGGGVFSAGVVTWNLGTLAPGQGGTRDVAVSVPLATGEGTLLRPAVQLQAAGLTSARAAIVSAVQSGAPLLVEYEFGPDPIANGEWGEALITVTNTSGAIIDPVLEARLDQIAVGLHQNLFTRGADCTVSGTTPNVFCDGSERVRWDLAPLGPGERVTVSMPFGPPGGGSTPPNGTLLALRAEAWEPLAGQIGESRLARYTTRVQHARTFELALDESDDPVAPGPGSNVTYTLTYANVTNLAVAPVTLSLPIPVGATFVSASDGGISSGGVVTWSIPSIAAGQSGTRQLTVAVAGLPEGEMLRTIAQIQDAAGNAARSRSAVVVQSGSPLRLELETLNDSLVNGEYGELLLKVSNVGGAPIDTVLELRQDEYTPGINQNFATRGAVCNVSGATPNTSCDPVEIVRWDLPPLAAGEHMTLSYPLGVFGGGSSPPSGTLVLARAELYEPVAGATGESRFARRAQRVQYPRALELALDASDDPVAPGAALTYTATFGNSGAVDATTTTLSVPVPAGATFVSANGGGTFSAGVVTWNLGTLAAGQGGTRQLTVQVGAGVPAGEIVRTAARIQDGLGRSSRAPSAVAVRAAPPLRLEIEPDQNPVLNGEYTDVLFTVTNVSGTAIDPVLELRLDEWLPGLNQNFATRGAVCNVAGAVLNTSCDPVELVRWDLAPLDPGEHITVSYPVGIFGGGSSPPSGLLVPLRANAYQPLPGAPGESAQARQTLRTRNPRALELGLDVSADPAPPSANLVYTATYANSGGTAAAGALLTLPVPAGASFVSATGGGTLSAGVVTWNLGTLLAGQAGTRQATFLVGALPEGEVLRTAADLADAAGNSARAASVTPIDSDSRLRLEIEPGPDPVRNGQGIELLLTVTNVGGAPLDTVLELRQDQVIVALPQNFATGGAVCTVSGGVPNTSCDPVERVLWDLPALAAGERRTVSFPFFVAGGGSSPPPGTLVPVRAEVYEATFGQIDASRGVRRHVAVQWVPTFELALDESVDPVAPNADLTYTLTLGKIPAVLSSLGTVSFALPAGTSFVSATGGGTHLAGVVTWNLPPLPAGQTGTRQVTVHVDPSVPQGTPLVARAQVTDFAGWSARAHAVTVVQSGAPAPLQLSLVATPDPARPADVLDVDLQVTNVSGSTISDAVVDARVLGFVVAFTQASATPAADCTVSGGVPNTNCDLAERVRWALPPLGPGASTTVSMPPQIPGGGSSPANGTLVRLDAVVESGLRQSVAKDTVRIGFLDTDADGVLDTFDNCGALANPGQEDGDADESGNLCDLCPTLSNGDQSDVDADLVGDVCDNCVTLANPRVSATYLTTNPWATLTGGQRDDDHDGYGNRCDAKFPGSAGALVGAPDVAQFRASNGKNRTLDVCGNTGTRPCAIFDMDDAATLIGAGDLAIVRALNGKLPGPKCASCPLPCAAGASGTCF